MRTALVRNILRLYPEPASRAACVAMVAPLNGTALRACAEERLTLRGHRLVSRGLFNDQKEGAFANKEFPEPKRRTDYCT